MGTKAHAGHDVGDELWDLMIKRAAVEIEMTACKQEVAKRKATIATIDAACRRILAENSGQTIMDLAQGSG